MSKAAQDIEIARREWKTAQGTPREQAAWHALLLAVKKAKRAA